MGFLKKLFGLEPNLIKLLSAGIVTDEDHRYFVSFSKHHPQLQLPEFVRLILHYYAKILFNFDPSDPEMSQSAFILKNMIRSVLDNGIRKDSNIFQNANINDVATMVFSAPVNKPREIVTTLFFVDTTRRHITTDIPRNAYAQHMAFSVMALIQASLNELDYECIDVLNCSLMNMNKAYDSGQSYSDMNNLATIPTMAYLSAIEGPALFPKKDEEFIRTKIRHADQLACKMWTHNFQLDEVEIQTRHGLATVVAAIASVEVPNISSDAVINIATEHLNDMQFKEFLCKPEVHEGLQKLVRDTQTAAKSSDISKLSELLQTFLLLPVGGPSNLSLSESRDVVECSKIICADTIATSL
jgi:hypothetical protein